MARKTLKILTTERQPTNSNIFNFIIKTLESINYSVTTANIELQEAKLLEEISLSVKQYDVVLFIGALGTPHSKLIWQAVADAFHQPLVENKPLETYTQSNTEYSTLYAKRLQSENNGTFPIMYVQGLFLITDDSKLLEPSIVNIAVPFLKHLSSDIVFKRKLTIETESGCVPKPFTGSGVHWSCHKTLSNHMEIELSSSNMTALYNYEKRLTELCKILHQSENSDIEDLVYKQQDLHVKKSVDCIEECFKRYSPENVFVSFNGGKDCTVLLHLTIGVLRRKYPHYRGKICCVYMENANPFPELNRFIEESRQYYNLDVIKLTKSIKDSLTDVLATKPNMKAVLMGTRRSDPFSEHLQPFQMTDQNWPQVMRVSPILDWHYSQVWDYLLHLKIPYCSLYDIGYTSLGNVANTIPNPFLILNEGDNEKRYLPAYKLLDASQERSGRL